MRSSQSVIAAACMAVLAAAGCSAGDSKPLAGPDMDAALAPPDLTVLRVQAQAICHPILRPVTFDGTDGISPDEAAILAVLANPSLRAVRDQRGIVAAQVVQAGLLPNPVLDFTNEYPYRGPDHHIAYGVPVKWDITQLIPRKAKIEAAQSQAASVDLDIAWQEWQVAQSARGAVYKRIALEAQLALAMDVDRRLRQTLATIRKAEALQQKTEIDLAAAETASREAHATVLGLERDLARQKQALNRLLGLPGDAALSLKKGVELPSRLDVPAAERLEKDLQERRLDLLALRRGYDSQQATVRAAVLSRFPKVTVGTGVARDTAGAYTAGYGLAVDLPIFDRNQGSIAIETATRRKLFDEFVNRVFEGRADIAAAIAEIRSINEQIAFAQASLPALQRLVAGYEKAAIAGAVEARSYFATLDDLAKKSIDILKLKQELVDAWISLENASGQYLPDAHRQSDEPAPRADGTEEPK